MTTQDAKKKAHFGLTRWQVSHRGSVAHIRVGQQPRTICGEVISSTGKPVEANSVNPPCQDCNRVLDAAKRRAKEEK